MRGVLPIFLLIPLLSQACKRTPATPDVDAAAVAAPVATAALVSDAGIAPARCKLESEGAATLHDVGDRRSLVVGEGIATTDGFVVGLLHTPATGAEAIVARVAGHQVAEEWVVAKGSELVPDAPPPRPLVGASGLYAAYVERGGARETEGSSRRIVLKKSGVAAPLAVYPERSDESLSFDAALSADGNRAAIVWDADAVVHGGITVAVVPLGGARPLDPRVVSGDTADPDGPRVAPRAAGGWWVAWLAHRPEAPPDASVREAGPTIEAPGEERSYSWVEIVSLGDDGTPSGAPRRITSPIGHASSFDFAPRPDGLLDVVARDETQAREGEGGRVLHVVVRPDGGADEPTVMVSAGVGRGSVDLVTGESGHAWLTFPDAQDRTLAVPLGSTRAPLGLPSVEDALESGRLLTLANAGPPAQLVAVFPASSEGGALFREVTCAP
ncbi:MAG: hypothetical protein ACLQVI_16150 [Polyangiaceae bacterium]